MAERSDSNPLELILSNEPFYWPGQSDQENGHAILLLHGLGGGCYELRPIAEHLHVQGLAVQGINYPGHSEPAGRMPHSTWPEWYAHAEAAYLGLKKDYHTVSLVGFSTGCPLALRLAHHHAVNRLVLLSPFLEIKRQFRVPLEPMLPSVSRWLEHVPRLSLPIRDRQIQAQARAMPFIETFNLRAVDSALEMIREVKPLLGGLKNPTLIIQSRRDSVVDPRGAQYLMQHLGSADKSLHWLRDSDHIIPLDVEREFVLARTLEFLSASL